MTLLLAGNIARYNSFLDALARYRSSSSPTVRQLLIEALSPISEAVDWVVSSLLQSAVRHVSARNGQATSRCVTRMCLLAVVLTRTLCGDLHVFQCINDCSCVQRFSFTIDVAESRSVDTVSTA